MTIIWIIIFIVSLALLVKSSDWLLDSAEKIGLRAGLSPFIIGITIVAFGTSFPELVSSFFAIFEGVPEVVSGNVIGSNIANILLVVGAAVVIGRQLTVSTDLIDLDLPLLAISTAMFVMVAWDANITFIEAIVLLIGYIIYVVSAILYKENKTLVEPVEKPKVTPIDIVMLFIGILGLAIGAKYLIDSLVALSEIFQIGAGVIAVTAVAVGTSLPELLVSVKAALKNKAEVALGNVFGSNVFNVFVVIGLPGLFGDIPIDATTMAIAVPTLIIATLLFIFSGISKRIHFQEGALFLIIYVIFTAKLFNLF